MSTFWLSRDEVRELDRRAIEGFGVPGVVLMENAGRGCAELLMQLNPARKPVVILCGPGNNGGDGFVIARHLDNHGCQVGVWLLADESRLAGDAAVNFTIIRQTLPIPPLIGTDNLQGDHPTGWMSVHLAERMMHPGMWAVDAMFGTGLSRGLDSPYSAFAAVVNTSGAAVLAVDIPSGLDCDTGEPLGPTVKAAHTATFVAHKKGFLNPASRPWTGEVHVIDIGAPRVLIDEYRRRRESAPPPATPEP